MARRSPCGGARPAGSSWARPAATIAATNRGTVSALRPRTWRLARLVSSIAPLPSCAAACANTRAAAAGSTAPGGLTRTSKPSPDLIGCVSDGHQPFGTTVFMSRGSPPRHSAAAATDRGVTHPGTAPPSPPAPPGSPAAGSCPPPDHPASRRAAGRIAGPAAAAAWRRTRAGRPPTRAISDAPR